MPYYRPISRIDPVRTPGAMTLADGWCWFDQIECLEKGRVSEVIPAREAPADVLTRLTTTRRPLGPLDWSMPRVMGILNVTPDSFSDGGRYTRLDRALSHARQMIHDGAAIIDIGGESTRPGAAFVPAEEEIRRIQPMVEGLANDGVVLSLDTRKAAVAEAGLQAGVHLLNDVSALAFDPDMADVVAKSNVPICLMHTQGNPETMQDAPCYDDALLDVYDHLAERIGAAESAGIARDRIIVDPGIGFGKTVAHNIEILARLDLFHALGCPILLGVSRKRFIGALTGAEQADARFPGSIAVGLAGIAQGVQILRVHDVPQTRQAISLQAAIMGAGSKGQNR
ncbi:dihydropteroate synthase [Qingshengfaniella alkalisoli]|uniref:Dihydropteroate synthase n=1 Tax=Qingshengfaniella alkalisoli TaxID=2599296 RepID=A0A5B8J4C3_9RHOB|nr:dihydropteroate synthase [Qingshengfaniella alkalisoli]QDY69120.1 dihydropteroate synthase [Qingshengfaniella alkalisoli]